MGSKRLDCHHLPDLTTGMSKTLRSIIDLTAKRDVRISDHGYDELAQDGILAREVIAGVPEALVLEDYPGFPKGPCVLVLQKDQEGNPIHVVWGLPKGHSSPAVMVTAYRPDPKRWSDDFTLRRK